MTYKTIQKWLPLFILSLALVIIIVDTTLLNVSLRAIIVDLHTDYQGIQWVITVYALALVSLTITGGRLGDILGRKEMFIVGALLFAVGSFISSQSASLFSMISGEAVIEGVGAALMMPATASLLRSTYRGRDLGIAFGIWGGMAGIASAIGPVLGGWLSNFPVQHIGPVVVGGWHSGFLINVFIVIILVIGGLLFVKDSRERDKKPELDVVGVILSVVGLLSLVFGIIESSTYGWFFAKKPFDLFGPSYNLLGLSITPYTIAFGLIFIGIFIWWQFHREAQNKQPLVSLSLFTIRPFVSGSIVLALMSLGLTGLIFGLPLFFQVVRGEDALHTGLSLLPLSLAILVAAPLSIILVRKIPARTLIQAGLLFTMIAMVFLALSMRTDISSNELIVGLFVYGFGMGLMQSQLSTLALAHVPVDIAGEASGVNNTLRQLGNTLGSAIIGAIILGLLTTNITNNINNANQIPTPLKTQITSQVDKIESGETLSATQSSSSNPAVKAIVSSITSAVNDGVSSSVGTGLWVTAGFMFLSFLASFSLPLKVKEVSDQRAHIAVAGH